jgi:hypothetical protein
MLPFCFHRVLSISLSSRVRQIGAGSYSKVTLVKLYGRKHALTAADMLNDRVLPWFEKQGVSLLNARRSQSWCKIVQDGPRATK